MFLAGGFAAAGASLGGARAAHAGYNLRFELRALYGVVARGPQATASMGPLFLRSSYPTTRGGSLQIGISLEPLLALVWSR